MAYTKTIAALKAQEITHWEIGDALVVELGKGVTGYQWDNLAEALAKAGIDYKQSTLKAYHRVAASFPRRQDRVDGVSFAAHQAALTAGTVDNARRAITRAKEANGGKATRDGVLAEVRQMKGRTTNNTSDAVSAWRDLRRGVEKVLSLPESELEALLQVDNGTHAGEAPNLSRDLAKVSLRISDALAKAEKRMAQDKAAKAKRRAAKAPAAAPKAAKAPKADAPKRKPQVGKLGKGRGEG